MDIFFTSPDVRIGLFTCPQPVPHWIRSDRVVTGFLVVFPLTPGIVTHAGADSVVADSMRVMMYNLDEEYTRAAVDAESERSAVFAFSPNTVMEAARRYEPAIVERPSRPFSCSSGPADAHSVLLQRVMHKRARRDDADLLMMQELGLQLLECVLAASYAERGRHAKANGALKRSQVRRCEAIRSLLAGRFAQDLRLEDFASEAGLSTFHAARLFRRHTGTSIHQYRDRLRLHAALAALGERGVELASLALDLGYRHQSHLTNRFTRYFGLSPGCARRMIRESGTTALGRILQDRPCSSQ